nr:MAG TPA: Protein of unknown function (DUF2577) [Caudoviricetes sp.]
MDPFSEIINLMRIQGAIYNTAPIMLAIMTGTNTCCSGDLQIYAEDLYIPDRLLTSMCTKVNVPENHKDNSSYSAPLKAGDVVTIFKLNDKKYVILDRVVSGE